ncbi:7,8-didemethyl-8-hydroxy-5-deazariboflavin synthase subunit CofG [Candidatus Sumerlaeota bacterium]|nr:7,8-didemethyl-8-hydroxy-5-deazariboflavin synthase subunit CofG [Candidatus Sumerlaeota bacterium]
MLTRHCANKCGYCSYPHSEKRTLPSKKSLLAVIRQAIALGAVQVELIAGEGLDSIYAVSKNLRYFGYASFIDYLHDLLGYVECTNSNHPLFSLVNVGNLGFAELERLRPKLCAVQVMLESVDVEVQSSDAHRDAPCKVPERRLETILQCGRLAIPVATGCMLGIGESEASQVEALEIIAQVHQRYGHIQSFEIQTFWPQPGTLMANHPAPSVDDLLTMIVMARDLLPMDIPIIVKAQEHPAIIKELLQAGVTDFGGISVRREDETDPSFWKATIERARIACEEQGYQLHSRLPLHPAYYQHQYYPSGYPGRLEQAHQYHRTPHPQALQAQHP